jgi:segregation and condensation protein B
MSLKARIEAVIYAAEEPVTLAQLASLFREEALASRPDPCCPAETAGPALIEELSEPAADLPPDDEKKAARQLDRAIRDEIRALVDELIADYNTPDSGLEIREVAGGFRIGTRPEYHDAVRAFIKTLKPPLKLSLQALETLAVIAYKQPVTAPEIGEIRGVDASGVLGSLIARKLITTAGRKQVVGRPILYKTTKDFLLRFGLKDINELPSIEEFEKMAGELADMEPVQETISMEAPLHDRFDEAFAPTDDDDPEAERDATEVEPMANVHEPQADGDSDDPSIDTEIESGEKSGGA